MANSLHADILYDYLVCGESQQNIADNYGMSQHDVSTLIRKEYGINKHNTKWGRGKHNQAGKYPNLSYDDICAFIDSGSMDLDAWLAGSDGGYYEEDYDDGGYDDGYDDYDDSYDDGYDDSYDDSYDDGGYDNNYGGNNGGNYQPQQGRSGRKVTYVNPDDYTYEGPARGSSGRKVTYVNPDDYDDDGNYRGQGSGSGRGLLLILGAVILAVGWGVTKLAESENLFGMYLKLLWDVGYLWYGFIPGLIYGFFNYLGTRSIGAVLTNHALYTWTGLGYVIAGIVFFVKYTAFIPALILVVLGLVIGFAGYKLFFRG